MRHQHVLQKVGYAQCKINTADDSPTESVFRAIKWKRGYFTQKTNYKKPIPQEQVYCGTHHGEIVQGPIVVNGKIQTGLITLPRPDIGVTASFFPDDQCSTIDICSTSGNKPKARMALLRLLPMNQSVQLRGKIKLDSDIQIGYGSGSSTCDIFATIQLVNLLKNLSLTDYEKQRVIFEIEGASDPLALVSSNRTVVYGSRCGDVFVDGLPGLPDVICVGFYTSKAAVQTSSLVGRENYTNVEIDHFAIILDMAINAIRLGSLELLAKASTMSAIANQHRVPTHGLDDLRKITDDFSAAGLAVSHSGVAATLLFAPEIFCHVSWHALFRRLKKIGCFGLSIFSPNVEGTGISRFNSGCWNPKPR